MNGLLKTCVMGAAALALAQSANAAISLSDTGVVGASTGNGTGVSGGGAGTLATELAVAQKIIDLTVTSQTIGGDLFTSARPNEYSGTIPVGVGEKKNAVSGPDVVSSLWNYALAKYGTKYILFDLTKFGYTLPEDSQGIFNNPGGNGFGLSDYSAFNFNNVPPGGTVPEPSTYFAGLSALSLLLLGYKNRK